MTCMDANFFKAYADRLVAFMRTHQDLGAAAMN
jgi:hypothetical protein